MDIILEDIVQDFESNIKNGSTELAVQAINILNNFHTLHSEFNLNNIYNLANRLVKSKPAMPAVRNVVKYYLKILADTNDPDASFSKVLGMIYNSSDYIQSSLVEYISMHSPTKFNLITCSYSSNIVSVIRKFKQLNPVIYAVNSIWRHTNYSDLVLNELNKSNIAVIKIELEDISDIIGIKFCVIGTDANQKGLGCINGLPSRALADYAFIRHIPFLVLSESFKTTNELHIHDGFDLVPVRLITHLFIDDNKWI